MSMDMVMVSVLGVVVLACLGVAVGAIVVMGRALKYQGALLKRFVDAWVTPEMDQASRLMYERPLSPESAPDASREQNDPRKQYRYEVRPTGDAAYSLHEDFPLTGTGGGMGA